MTRAPLVWAATLAFAAVYFALGADRYATFGSGSDLGLFTQTIASAAHGFTNTTERGSHFTFHFSPVLAACVPFVLLARSPLALVAIQAAACALAAPPLYLVARRRMPDGLAAGVACTALLYPPLAGVTFADFHENAFAPAAILWLLWAYDARRLALAALFGVLALCVKEDEAPIVAFTALCGLAAALRARDRRAALLCAGGAAAACATFAAFFTLVRPLAGASAAWAPTHFYAWGGAADPRLTAPWWSIGRPAYALEALAPLALAPLLAPALALALPGLAEVLASHESITYTMGQHYAAVWIGEVLFAYALAIGRVHARAPRRAAGLARAAAALCALVLAVASPTHWGHYVRVPSADDRALARELAALPPGIEVGAPDEIYAHLGFDPRAQLGFDRGPRYALLDARHTRSALTVEWLPVLRARVAFGLERVAAERDGVVRFERTALGARVAAASLGPGAAPVVASAR